MGLNSANEEAFVSRWLKKSELMCHVEKKRKRRRPSRSRSSISNISRNDNTSRSRKMSNISVKYEKSDMSAKSSQPKLTSENIRRLKEEPSALPAGPHVQPSQTINTSNNFFNPIIFANYTMPLPTEGQPPINL